MTNPRRQLSMAEVHDCCSITEAIVMEDLGFSPRGRVKEDIEAGTFLRTGDLPAQPDGGLKCFGHPVGTTGVRMVYECYLQLRGKSGERQIKNPKLGLTPTQGDSRPALLWRGVIPDEHSGRRERVARLHCPREFPGGEMTAGES